MGTAQETGSGVIAVDDVVLRQGEECDVEPAEAAVGTPLPTTTTPLPTPTPGFGFYCDFEDGVDPLCGWQDISPSGFEWSIVKVRLA